MLQQILRDMWVDPEILAELDDTQKQILFCKMREEQVRRWHAWDQKVTKVEIDRTKLKNGKKQVQFLQGEDGEPWVWVMGEHANDKSIDTMLTEEATKEAFQQARVEAHQLRKSVEKELTQLIDYQPLDGLEQKFDLSLKSMDNLEEALEIYCSVDELRQRIQELEPEVQTRDQKEDRTDFQNEKNILNGSLNFNFIEGKREVLQEIVVSCGGPGVSGRVAAWERRVAAVRAGDLLRGIRARRARTLREAISDNDDAMWKEQERKVKEAEATMRNIARAAREEHKRTSLLEPPVRIEPCLVQGKPPNKEAVEEWFINEELKKGNGLDDHGKPADWFHGLISRSAAESLLNESESGTFLVRLSERVWGYAISYREKSRVKHYLVEAVGDGYRLLGSAQRLHRTLGDLIKYHSTVAITEQGGECLTTPCSPAQTPSCFATSPSS